MQKLVRSFRPLLCRAAPTDFLRLVPEWNPAPGRAAHSIAGNTCGKCANRGSPWQHSPRAPAFQEIRRPAENVVQVHGAGLGPAAGRLQRGQNQGKLFPADVAGIGMRHDYPSPSNSLNLSYFRDREQALRGCFRSLGIDLYYAHYAQTLSQRPHRRTVGCSRSTAPTSQTRRTPSRSKPAGGGQRHPVHASERMRLAHAPQRPSSMANSVQILSEVDSGRNIRVAGKVSLVEQGL